MKAHKIISQFLLITLLINLIPVPVLAASPVPQVAASSVWSMTAGNPQRTSWVSGTSNEVRGNLGVEWYHVIDPYIDNKVQVIASDGKVFVSSSKGLYAFNATDGAQAWAYGTELPLGNSPTYFNGILYVGGYDHKIHAINATNGQVKSGWTFLEAGAGYETNPLVISDTFTGNQPVVLAGNRDGIFYAIDGNTGALKWKYQTGGPIRFSAAYKNGVVYFAADDSYAYALNVSTGSLAWKSAKLPGTGFDNYWPVVYTDPASGKDYVLYSGSKKADWAWLSSSGQSLYFDENYQMYANQSGCTGTTTLDCSVITNYMASKPYKRNLFILDSKTGSEYTPYAPINWSGVTHNGNKHPPIVGGDGQLYSFIGYSSGGNNGANGWITRWKIGSSNVDKLYNNHSGAADEPVTFTGGGNLIYWGEGVNSDIWGTLDLTKPLGSNSYSWQDLRSLPGAGAKYTELDLTGKFGGNNGVYGYFDGLNNLSPVPYNNKLYIINGNVLFALSTTGGAKQLATVQAPATQASGTLSTSQQVIQQRLATEIQKMLTAGHLRPGYADSGIPSAYLSYHGNASVPGNHLGEYFHNPADTLYTLSSALPYLSPTLQAQVKTYLQQEQANYPVDSIAHIGWKNGSPREAFSDPPEMSNLFSGAIPDSGNNVFIAAPRSTIWYPNPCCSTYINVGTFPQDSFYGAWKYAQVFPDQAKPIFDKMKSKLQKAGVGNGLTDANLITYPYILNQYIAGYRGYIELEKLAGYTTDIAQSAQYAEYSRLLNLRINNFSKDAPSWPGLNYNNNLSVARNFMFMVPELADALRASKLTQVQQALNEYQTIEPYWFVSRYDRTFNEGVFQPLYDNPALFQARAYILKLPYTELVKYLDVPAFEKGDLFYIQNLVALLQSSGIATVPTETPAPTSTATLTPGTGTPGATSTPTAALTTTSTATLTPVSTNTPTVVAASSSTPTTVAVSTNTSVPASPSATPTTISVPASENIAITGISDNGSVAKYDKKEITFNVTTSASNLQLPYDPAAPAGATGATGISVDGVFTSPTGKVWVQPGFYYQVFDDQTKNGSAWFYTTGQAVWKIRFSPDEVGTWQYYIKAQDRSGKVQTGVQSFTVTASSSHGFIRPSKTDPRYFEYSDGTYFPALSMNSAYNEIQWSNPADNLDYFQKTGGNGIQVVRMWLSQWSIFGSSWNPWYSIRNDYDGYVPRAGLVTNGGTTAPMSQMRLVYADNNSYWFDACRFIGGFQTPPAVKQNTKYHIKIRYKAQGISGPRDTAYPGYGLVAKVQNPNDGNWHTNCYNGGDPKNGVKVTGYGQDTQNWAYLEGEWSSGTGNFLPIFYLALENANNLTTTVNGQAWNWHPEVDIDSVFIGEDLGSGNYGPNIVTKPSMEHISYYMERNAYAFDKVLDLARQNGVYLKLVVMEKNEQIENEIGFDGKASKFDNNNFYGNYRTMTAVRWYQQAWWRYLQARWGYSPNIFSFEAVNEAAPGYTNHYGQVDEMGKYLHCGVFGVVIPPYDGQKCTISHPDAHMVSTSFTYGFEKNLFANSAYPNVDYADIHRYIAKDTDLTHFQDTALSSYDLGLAYGALQSGSGKPIMRGETGLINQDANTDSMADVSADKLGIWLHNLIWGGINPTGLIESYWYARDHIYNSVDLRGQYKYYYLFIKDIPLNNGKYVDAAATTSDPKLRAWGQKDLTNQRAHLWIANTDHVWTNTGTIAPISGTVTISKLAANAAFTVEVWDTYKGVVAGTQTLSTNANGDLVLTVPNLTTDLAVRISPQTGPVINTPTATVTSTVTFTPTVTSVTSPTATRTSVSQATATFTSTSLPQSTATSTSTSVPQVTATPTRTNTPATLPTNTSTATPIILASATNTSTKVPNTATSVPTNTSVPNTATGVPTNTTAPTVAWTFTPTTQPVTATFTSTAIPTQAVSLTPTNTPTAIGTFSPSVPLILLPASITSQTGSTKGVLEALGKQDQAGIEDDPSKYVFFATRKNRYTGYLSFVGPANISPSLVSKIVLQVNIKGGTTSKQTWSIYDWSKKKWVVLDIAKTSRGDDRWQMLEFQIPYQKSYVSSGYEVRIQLQLSETKTGVKIDYEAIKVTFGSSVPSPTATLPPVTFTPTVMPPSPTPTVKP